MPNIDPYRNFNFRVEIGSTSSMKGHTLDARIAALEVLPPGGIPRIGLLLPAVQKVRVAVGDVNMDGLRAPGGDPTTVGLLLPAVQKVREAARRSVKFELASMAAIGMRSHKVAPAASGWTFQILPYIEQDNIHKLQNLVRTGAGGALALVPSQITDGTSNTMLRSLIGATDLYEWIKIKSEDGGFAALLDKAVLRVENDGNKPPTVFIGFSASRRV